jgi:hypothetical protein
MLGGRESQWLFNSARTDFVCIQIGALDSPEMIEFDKHFSIGGKKLARRTRATRRLSASVSAPFANVSQQYSI